MGPPDLFEQAVRLHLSGQLPEAEAAYRRVLEREPGRLDAALNLGAVLSLRGRPAEAADFLQAVACQAPDDWSVHFNLGHALRLAGRLDDALAAFRHALRNSPRPESVLHLIGLTCLEAGHSADARAALAEALRLAPANPDLWLLDGLAATQLGDLPGALDASGRALELRPNFAEALNLRGAVLLDLGREGEAEPFLLEAVRLRPDFVPALNNLALQRTEAGDSEAAFGLFGRALAGAGVGPQDHSNFLLALNYGPDPGPDAMLAEHRRWAERWADALAPAAPPEPRPRSVDGRLRLGYVSPDFRSHPMASFVECFLPRHDRTRFHVTAYSDVRAPDAVTERIQQAADCWRPINGLSHDAVARLVREDGIDVLVDLAGHTARNRLLVFARRPAPLQVALFAYPNSTGLRTVQYRISDAVADPAAAPWAHYSEALARLPEFGWCYTEPADAPPVSAPPARAGRITFGSLNNLAKVNDQVVALWARVLREAPGSRLMILIDRSGLGRSRLRRLFGAAGIEADRVEIVPRLSRRDYFDLFARIDLALDPFPYNGVTTTCDTLWMGVPVLTLAGASCRGRQGLALLTHAGLPEFIAATADDYVRIAAECARDPGGLHDVRKDLRERVRHSPIVDAGRFTCRLEEAYLTMWAETFGT